MSDTIAELDELVYQEHYPMERREALMIMIIDQLKMINKNLGYMK